MFTHAAAEPEEPASKSSTSVCNAVFIKSSKNTESKRDQKRSLNFLWCYNFLPTRGTESQNRQYEHYFQSLCTTCLALTALQVAAAACGGWQSRLWFRTGALSWTGLSYSNTGAANSLVHRTGWRQVQSFQWNKVLVSEAVRPCMQLFTWHLTSFRLCIYNKHIKLWLQEIKLEPRGSRSLQLGLRASRWQHRRTEENQFRGWWEEWKKEGQHFYSWIH